MKPQQGVALITILVMVALATILAATIAKRQANTAENTAYLMRQNQSLLYAKSAEAFFSELLVDDAENAGDIDHLQENWAKPMPGFPVEDGFISGTLKDQSGKFNLNSLVNVDGTPNPQAQVWFEKLLLRVGLPEKLSEAVIDWQDADNETIGSMGAEASYYQGLAQGYLPANNKFHSVEELKMVRGFEGKKYLQIVHYVSAVQDSDTKVNINTAPAILLASLDPKLDVKAVQQVLQQRQTKLEHFSSVNELWGIEPFSQVSAEVRSEANNLLDVKSAYFKAKIEIMLSGRKRQFSSDLVRKDKSVYIASRSMAPF
ncbi:type II secretion system minor pseudopilin GspK [Acinetobacter sp. BSP-28]|uniref:type II secretion system minor pseudopilin GspK n=1 Tax=Acinetobacter sp. BSP-28 TaxID=3344661 RepID=UPI00376FA509